MIKEDKRKAIYALYQEGKGKKEIARLLKMDKKTVKRIISLKGDLPDQKRRDKTLIDEALLKKVHSDCKGYLQRVHETLAENYQIKIGYSTLTRLIHEMEISKSRKRQRRCHQFPDLPGAEMQHDTSPYRLKIADRLTNVVCSGLYYRYSKMRYVKFYKGFNRFNMKCFMHEALTHFGSSAEKCIIDNTNLAVWYGTGSNAVFVPEMKSFARNYSFEWLAHEKGHSNRKAGKERNFWTVETNFFPGRKFKSITDLNEQAFDWATNRYAKRPLSKTRLIPADLFEDEKPYLEKLPPYVEEPFLTHEREIDQYGYIAFKANYYWVPGKQRFKVTVIEYAATIKIRKNRELLIEYALPEEGIKYKKITPDGVNTNPYEPTGRTVRSDEEEIRLRKMDPSVESYLDYIKSRESDVRNKHKFIRELHTLSKKMTPSLFIKTIERGLNYHVTRLGSLERIATQLLERDGYVFADEYEIESEMDDDYQKRDTYLMGRFSSEVDLKTYYELLGNSNDDDDDDDDDEEDDE